MSRTLQIIRSQCFQNINGSIYTILRFLDRISQTFAVCFARTPLINRVDTDN